VTRAPSAPVRGAALASLLALAVVVAFAAPAAAQAAAPTVAFDYFADVRPQAMDFSPGSAEGCDAGGFAPDVTSFTFTESGGALPDGRFAAGCGTASVTLRVPAGTERLEVRFGADRRIDALGALPPSFVQEVLVRDGTGATVAEEDVFGASDPAQALTPFELEVPLPAGVTAVTVSWRFADTGSPGGVLDPASGAAYAATVEAPSIAFSGVPAPASVVVAEDREGALVRTETRVVAEVPGPGQGDYAAAVRVRVGQEHAFDRLVAPDGAILREVTGADGPGGPDVLVEERSDGVRHVTVPPDVVAAHGAGAYTLVFEDVERLPSSAALTAAAWVLLAAPLPFAVVAFGQARAFEREAFGGFARSARNLRLAVLFVFAYYLVVVLSAVVSGRLDLMALWPMPLEGVLLYAQVVAAVVAFVVLWLVAREMYGMTRPRPLRQAGTAKE